MGGRYEVGPIIGRGGMASVHRCHDRRTGREVAVKVFRTETDLIDADERHRREVELLSTLNDPGLVTVLDADLGDGSSRSEPPYLVTDLVEGSTLAQRLRRGRLEEGQVAKLGSALCQTLAYVHDRGIVHRDVKPANILIPNTGQDDLAAPKLVDFGIAVAADRARLTTDGATVGTANYLSPEQVHGDPVTPASDIYSLGLVLIEALTGALAYPGSGVEAALARLNRPPAIPRTTSRAMRNLLEAMTAREPRDRPDARHIAESLDQLTPADQASSLTSDILRLGRPANQTDPRRNRGVGPPRQRRHQTATALRAALILGCATLLGLLTAASSTRPTPPSPANSAHTDPPTRPISSTAESVMAGGRQTNPAPRHAPGPNPAPVQLAAPAQVRDNHTTFHGQNPPTHGHDWPAKPHRDQDHRGHAH